jgi:hypothetical protein
MAMSVVVKNRLLAGVNFKHSIVQLVLFSYLYPTQCQTAFSATASSKMMVGCDSTRANQRVVSDHWKNSALTFENLPQHLIQL